MTGKRSMRMARCVGAIVSTAVMSPVAAQEGAFDIPKLDGVRIDGEAADWGAAGLRIEAMKTDAQRPAVAVEGGLMRLGWDVEGLLLCAEVLDDAAVEGPSHALWEGDGVEVFLTPSPGHGEMVQFIVAPGSDPKHEALRVLPLEHRQDPALLARDLEVVASSTTDGANYVVELRVPWALLGIEPAVGREVGVQVIVNDSDAKGARTLRHWHPDPATWTSSGLTHRVRLASSAGPAVRAVTTAADERLRRVRVEVVAVPQLTGRPVRLMDGETLFAEATLEAEDGAAVARVWRAVSVDVPIADTLAVHVDGLAPMTVALPDRKKAAADAVFEQPIVSDGFIFHGEVFPAIDFAQPSLMEDALGRYRVEVAYFDADHEPVERAAEPGRYGAVIRFVTEGARTLTRYRTLYRTPDHVGAWGYDLDATIRLPEHFGVSPTVAERRQDEVRRAYQWSFEFDAERSPFQALTLAGLAEIAPGEPDDDGVYGGAWVRDRQWWVEQKRRMNGNADRYPDAFPGPRPIGGASATVLRDGAADQAGMNPEAVAAIDELLTQWAQDSDEGFIACVARRGVVVLHRAYGTRDGEPMTTQTPSAMASLSKLVSGTQVMMAVDAGLIDLDEPVDTYLPELRGAGFAVVPTMRHLYTHTAGMSTHRGEEDHDLEHLVAECAPHLPVGEAYRYNGMSLELGLKVLEQVTGEAYPRFAKRHLLDPLGCRDTDALNASWNTRSTAYDMAAIGQMLLNRGAYGDLRFMREAVFEQMLPGPLTATLGPDAVKTYGIGCDTMSHDGLSASCFGHGAASSATLRIDPELDLVISMTRDAAGENFDAYHPRFIRAVVDAIAD
ncbi:MAG: serine hydrolase [Planctomycetota bacterium]